MWVLSLSLSLSFPISIPLRSEMGALFSSLDLFRASVRPQYNGTNWKEGAPIQECCYSRTLEQTQEKKAYRLPRADVMEICAHFLSIFFLPLQLFFFHPSFEGGKFFLFELKMRFAKFITAWGLSRREGKTFSCLLTSAQTAWQALVVCLPLPYWSFRILKWLPFFWVFLVKERWLLESSKTRKKLLLSPIFSSKRRKIQKEEDEFVLR